MDTKQEWEHKIQGKLLEKRGYKEGLQEELRQAQVGEVRLRQRQIDLAQEIKSVDGAIGAYEELLGVKKKAEPVKPKPKREPQK